jgi:hypothetical protein
MLAFATDIRAAATADQPISLLDFVLRPSFECDHDSLHLAEAAEQEAGADLLVSIVG